MVSIYVWIVSRKSGAPADSIFSTTDGGTTWRNETRNLPNVTINNLSRETFSGRYIYCATSQGSYRIDPYPENMGTITWEIVITCDNKKHPKFTWADIGPEEADLKELRVYRKKPGESNYTSIATLSITTREYTDCNVEVFDCSGPNCLESDTVRYYVSKVDSSLQEAQSNTVKVPVKGGGAPQKTIIGDGIEVEHPRRRQPFSLPFLCKRLPSAMFFY
jgi:hypothetical protein